MSRDWPPDGKIVRIRPVRGPGPWGSAEDYVPELRIARRRRVLTVLAAAAVAGVVVGFALQRLSSGTAAIDSSAIDWNAVQAVPTRTPDAADVAWEKRAELQPSPSWGGLGGGATSVGTDGASERLSSAADAAGPPPTSPTRGEAIYAYDGDTFRIGAQVVRVANIDAPETHPPRCLEEARLGLAATQKLGELLGSGPVTLSGAGHDRYGRELRFVRVNGQDVGEAMIGAGLARGYAGEKRQAWC